MVIDHGDPQSDSWDLLKAIAVRDVPPTILGEGWMDLEEAIDLDDVH
ncbi:MAG: hypothetical protein Q8O67_32700 [Deltaproteobacteria bacterium]|nr:hypothetical protein [Deltaproteobacteria bacterium]